MQFTTHNTVVYDKSSICVVYNLKLDMMFKNQQMPPSSNMFTNVDR